MNEYVTANRIMRSIEMCAIDLTQWQKQVIHHHVRMGLVAGYEKGLMEGCLTAKKQGAKKIRLLVPE